MGGRTGYPDFSNSDGFGGPEYFESIEEHFDALIGESVPTVTDLPSTGNWPNRTIMAEDTLWLYVWNGTAWEVLSSPWTAYTPVWTSAGGSTAMGASVLTGAYQRVRGAVQGRIYFKLGTGSSQGSGNWRFSLPVAAATGSSRTPVPATIENSGVGFYTGTGFIEPSSSRVEQIAMNSGTGHVAGGTGGPTWQPNSVIALEFTYQV